VSLLRKSCIRPYFSMIFVKYAQYLPQIMKKPGSNQLSLATTSILGQAPRAKLNDFPCLSQINTLSEYESRQRFRPRGRAFPQLLTRRCGRRNRWIKHQTDALLQIAAATLIIDEKGTLHMLAVRRCEYGPGIAQSDGIDPHHPLRLGIPERDVLSNMFKVIHNEMKKNECTQSILVGHDTAFKLNFLNTAVKRPGMKRNPFTNAAISHRITRRHVIWTNSTTSGIPRYSPRS